MKRLAWSMAVVVVLAVAAAAAVLWHAARSSPNERPAAAKSHAVAVFDSTEIDAGALWSGQSARFTFRFRNAGTTPLTVVPQACCGTKVIACDASTAPGARGQVVIELKAQGVRGRLAKEVVLNTNDPARDHVVLRPSATVKPLVELRPGIAPLVRLKSAGATLYEMTILSRGPHPMRFGGVVTDVPFVTGKIKPGPNSTSHRLVLNIAPSAPFGRTPCSVTVPTDSPYGLKVTAMPLLEKGIYAEPASVFFGVIPPGGGSHIVREVSLVRHGRPFRVRGASSNDPGLRVEVGTGSASRAHRFTVAYRGGWQPGVTRHQVTIDTDDPAQPHIVVPVGGRVIP